MEELQEEFNVEQIARVDALTDDIESVIVESTHVQSYGYVVGEVADYGVSDGTVYFELVHRKPSRKNKKDDRLQCAVFQDQRDCLPATIKDGQRVAVSGHVEFYAPHTWCSIVVDDVAPAERERSGHLFKIIHTDRRIQIALATGLLLAALAVVVLLVLWVDPPRRNRSKSADRPENADKRRDDRKHAERKQPIVGDPIVVRKLGAQMTLRCERCGRAFEKQSHLDVHPCPEIVRRKTARTIRAQFDPAQRFLDEDY